MTEVIVYEYNRYVCDSSTLWTTLQKYGVAIIPGVLSQSECKEMNDGMWDTLETITQNFNTETTPGPIDRYNKDTWRSIYELYPGHSMLLQHWSVGHANYIWKLRQNPKILDIWTRFWEVSSPKELLVSFDGVSYHLPPEITNRGWYKSHNDYGGWLHSDQSFTRPSFECVQSWVTGYDVNDNDASLTILEGSHLYHADYAKKFNITDTSDWSKLETKEQYEYYIKAIGRSGPECPRRTIKCPRGSIVFWDSRTIHAGQEPIKTRVKPHIRNVAYLCYTPRSLANQTALNKKIKYFEEMRMTNHWPHKIKVFGKFPYTRGKPLPNIHPLPKPELQDIGRCLVGYPIE